MSEYLNKDKIDVMMDSRVFKYAVFPIIAITCLILSVTFYGFIDSSFIFLQADIIPYETPAQEMWRGFAANLMDQSIKFGLSTVLFFTAYVLVIAALTFFFCRK